MEIGLYCFLCLRNISFVQNKGSFFVHQLVSCVDYKFATDTEVKLKEETILRYPIIKLKLDILICQSVLYSSMLYSSVLYRSSVVQQAR